MPTYHLVETSNNLFSGLQVRATDYTLWMKDMTPGDIDANFRSNVDREGMPRELARAWLTEAFPDLIDDWLSRMSRPANRETGKLITVTKTSQLPE